MNYYDLTLIEFLDVLFDIQNEYTYSITNDNGVRQELCTKTVEQYRSMVLTLDLHPKLKKSISASIEGKSERKLDIELTEIEIYNYLEKVTSNFDKEKLNSIYWVINAYYQTFRVEILNPESYGIYKYKKWDIPYHDVRFGSKIERYVDYKTMVSKTHGFMYMDIEYCWSLVNRKRSENQQLNGTTTGTKKQKTIKQPLSFAGLFKPEYRDRLNLLLDRLQSNGYTGPNNDWLIKTDTNEPAKLFYYLKDRGVIIAPKFAPSIKCFYKNFGCEVVEKFNGNPRATTRRNTESAKYSIDESEYKFLLSWIDKK